MTKPPPPTIEVASREVAEGDLRYGEADEGRATRAEFIGLPGSWVFGDDAEGLAKLGRRSELLPECTSQDNPEVQLVVGVAGLMEIGGVVASME